MDKKNYSLQSVKTFIKSVESRIPLHLKIVAEVRLMWTDIVGDYMSRRSEVFKCEYIPQKDENGQEIGEFHRRLIVKTENPEVKTAMTSYVSEYLERFPKGLRIHSMKFIQSKTPIQIFVKTPPFEKKPQNLSSEEEVEINRKVSSLNMSNEDEQVFKKFLKVWKLQQNEKI